MVRPFFFVSLATAVSAHFTLDYPKSRGFVEDDEPKFCGGFNSVSNRSQFPLGGGFLTLSSEHEKATITAIISFKANPTNFTDFTKTESGADQAPLQPFFQVEGLGSLCIPVNIGALKYPGVGDGTNATIQVQYRGGDGDLFQCADVTLSSSFTVPSSVNCTNPVGSLATATSTSTGPSATASVKSGSPRIVHLDLGPTSLCLAVLSALVLSI